MKKKKHLQCLLSFTSVVSTLASLNLWRCSTDHSSTIRWKNRCALAPWGTSIALAHFEVIIIWDLDFQAFSHLFFKFSTIQTQFYKMKRTRLIFLTSQIKILHSNTTTKVARPTKNHRVSNCPKISEFIPMNPMTVQPIIVIVVTEKQYHLQLLMEEKTKKDFKADKKTSCKHVIGLQTFQPLFWDSLWATSSSAYILNCYESNISDKS